MRPEPKQNPPQGADTVLLHSALSEAGNWPWKRSQGISGTSLLICTVYGGHGSSNCCRPGQSHMLRIRNRFHLSHTRA